MTVAQHTGTLADVRDARRALMAAVQPGWARALPLAGPAFMAASMATTPLLISAFGGGAVLIIFGAGIATLVAVLALGRRSRAATRQLRPYRLQLWSRRAIAAQWVLFVAWLILTLVLVVVGFRLNLPAWCFAVGCFVLIAVLIPSLDALAWRVDPYGLDSRWLRYAPDQPAVADAVIGSRQPLRVCAALAAVGRQIDAGLLARALRVSDQELGGQTAELVRAQYLYAYSEGPRWGFALTPVGRAAYRRHLRALLAAGQPASVRMP